MNMKMKTIVTIITLLLVLSTFAFSQYKSQVQEMPSLEQAVRLPNQNNNTSLNLFDPNRFSMNQSYSLSVGFSGNQNASMGMYLNNMTYMFSKDLVLNAKLGFVHNPLQMGGNINSGNAANNLIYGAEVLYRPTENMKLKVSFNKVPYSRRPYYSPYSYYPYY